MQNLQNQQWQRGDWEYHWNANGSLKSVKLPDGNLVEYEYDALGRRTKKICNNKIIRYLWDNNVLLHEWEYDKTEAPRRVVNKLGEISFDKPEPVQNLITWVYEQGSFVPCAKIVGNETFSIINDYIGRPIQAYDNNGKLVWQTDYDIYGNLRNLKGDRTFIPFRQLGQYEDVETGIYYNRFRYYDPNTGNYISKDPISILGGLNVYAYVKDVNAWVDIFGLNAITGGSYYLVRITNVGGHVHHMPAASINGISYSKGPAIWMEIDDHIQTASHGWQGKSGEIYRQKQLDFINKGQWNKAIEMDILDLHSKFGNKYDVSVHQMLDYAYNEGLITKKQRNKLKKIKCK